MRSFRVRVILRRPRAELWQVMRDHLPEIASRVENIDRIVPMERTIDTDGNVHLRNQWYVRADLPSILEALVGDRPFGWSDQNVWNTSTWSCKWLVVPFFFPDFIRCAGLTHFAPALESLGTRVTFDGVIDIKPGIIAAGPFAAMERPVRALAESVLTTIIPEKLERVFEAAARYRPAAPISQ